MQKGGFILLAIVLLTACQHKMEERFVKRNEVALCTQSFGSKTDPAILLIMGATASMVWWDEEFCKQLADNGFFVIRYDNRDVGKSTTYTPGTTPYKLDDMVADAFGILDAYELEQAHMVGMSLGGLLAQLAALAHPKRVKSLTLIATGPFGPSDSTIPAMDERILAFQSRASSINWKDEEMVIAYVTEGWELLSGAGRPFDRNRGIKLARDEFRRANNYESMFNHAGLQGGDAYYGRVNEIQQPTQIIHGTSDKIWHYKHALMLVKTLPNAQLLTLEGAGHELHHQDWDTIIQAVSRHVSAAN